MKAMTTCSVHGSNKGEGKTAFPRTTPASTPNSDVSGESAKHFDRSRSCLGKSTRKMAKFHVGNGI